jgi:uncharacterized protein (UPF0147 family)
MTADRSAPDVLRDIVEQRITALIVELENADWSAADVIQAIDDVVGKRRQDRLEPLAQARASVASGFVSDGNEG